MEYILLLPFIVAIIAFFVPQKMVKEYGLAFSSAFFILSLSLLFRYSPDKEINFFYYNPDILGEIGGSLSLGVDALGLLMVVLTNFVVLYVNLLSWKKNYSSSFYGLVFFMQFALIGVFTALNAILFYFFWELALIPIYFIVYKWGKGIELGQTFKRFFIYTFVGSLMILAAFILFQLESKVDTFDLNRMIPRSLDGNVQILYAVLLFIGFGVKIPIFPLHSWQSSTYRKAPAEGTILLSGIMLKMGLFGIYRWMIPFQDHANPILQKIFMSLAVVGILYGAIIALRRNDMKLIAAFSSLSHVGLIAAALFSYKYTAFQGTVLQMLVHGINIVGIFYVIDVIEEATGSRYLSDLGGLVSKYPVFSTFSFIIILGTIAVPLTNGFPGEMLLLLSVFMESKVLAILAGVSIILGAAYMLRFFQRAFMGEMSERVQQAKPIAKYHLVALGFIALLVLVLGIYPQGIMDMTAIGSQYLTNLLEIKK